MLTRIQPDKTAACRRLGDADPDRLFPHNLEYSCPARGAWNIVHTGMIIPEAQQIYACASGCLRGVILTAAEMGAAWRRRFSTIELREKDLLMTDNERLLIDGVSDILEKLKIVQGLPPAVLLFTACFHHFIGCDLNYVYRQLRQRFPTVDFAECSMDPIRQTKSLKPEERLRMEIARLWPPLPSKMHTCAFFGSNLSLSRETEIHQLCQKAGWQLLDWTKTKSYSAFLEVGKAKLILWQHPHALPACRELAGTRKKRLLYLPQAWRYTEIEAELSALAEALGTTSLDWREHRKKAEAGWQETRALLGDLPLALDYSFTLRPFSLARFLVEQGFNLRRIYADAVAEDDRDNFLWLQLRIPELELWSAKHPDLRLRTETSSAKILALGQKAAYYARTPYFVNLVDGGGLFGFTGSLELSRLIREACLMPKDTRKLIRRKGWGGPCVLSEGGNA